MKFNILVYSLIISLILLNSFSVASQFNFLSGVESFSKAVISHRFPACKNVHVAPAYFPHQIYNSFYSWDYSHSAYPNQYSVGNFFLTFFQNQSYERVNLKDVYRFSGINCAVAVIYIPETHSSPELFTWLFEITTPPYAPLLRKDEDHFIFVCKQTSTCDQVLLSSQYGNKIKYKISVNPASAQDQATIQVKTTSLFGGNNGTPILVVQNSSNISALFPDTTYNFNGKIFRVSNPRTKTYFDVDLKPNGIGTGKRGLYKIWLDEMMLKFNFTVIVFESSLSGGSGKQLPNGTWGGTVGDVMYGIADMGAFVGHTYNRHGLVGYSTTITYEWMFFITHKPRTYYSSTAIFRPLSFVLWIGFIISLVILAGAFKLIQKELTLESVTNYLFTSFMEQDASSCINHQSSSMRILVTFWLLFALILSTAYRGKLVSLIAFPMPGWVPWTYEDLAYSDFRIGLHVVGKGGAADSIFSSSSNSVFKILNSKMHFYSSPTDCMLDALSTETACVLWKCHFEYGLHAGFSDKFGRTPFHTSFASTYFLHDGFIWESRAVFHEHIDRVGWSILEMGITTYWLLSDQKNVRQMRFDYEKEQRANGTQTEKQDTSNSIDDEMEGPSKLKLVQFKGLFGLFFCGVMLSLFCFMYERWKKSGRKRLRISIL